MMAVEKCDVDIILLSSSFESRFDELENAIRFAYEKSKVVFTPGIGRLSNNHHVIGIHAASSEGESHTFSQPELDENCFSTLGISVPVTREGNVYKSGHTYAAAVATCIAAGFLRFAALKWREKSDEDRKWLFSTEGVRELFRLLSIPVQGSRFINPLALGRKGQGNIGDNICMIMELALRKGNGPRA